jgi:uncharacterized protein (DUF433 family)
MNKLNKKLIERIEINPGILSGKPVIKGTRISVEQIIRMLASGMTDKEIKEQFEIATEDVQAAMLYASELVHDFKAYPRQFAPCIKIS